jgi:glycosyltransferase involved in cell wall biosynthesis
MKVAILTNLQDMNPGYSLTGIIKDQIKMLARYHNEVHLFVCEVFNDAHQHEVEPAFLHKTVPFANLEDYNSMVKLKPEHVETQAKMREMMLEELKEFDVVFTHDLVFTGWNLPYALAISDVSSRLINLRWMHWIHSVPSANRDWWDMKLYPNSKLIFPNETTRIKVGEQYKGTKSDVRIIPHIKDPRTWGDFDEDTCAIIDEKPGLMWSDVVQILPAGTDRLSAKGVHHVIDIFAEMKRMHREVCLCIANQWATGRQRKETTQPFIDRALKEGLTEDEFFFTSELKNSELLDPMGKNVYENGLPKRILRELFSLSNVFIFPTREESFGLVVPEAAFAGVLPVLNKSLAMQAEITAHKALYFHFGSFNHNLEVPHVNYWYAIANAIIGRMMDNEAIMTKTICRQRYNMDKLYKVYYEPVMMELIEVMYR